MLTETNTPLKRFVEAMKIIFAVKSSSMCLIHGHVKLIPAAPLSQSESGVPVAQAKELHVEALKVEQKVKNVQKILLPFSYIDKARKIDEVCPPLSINGYEKRADRTQMNKTQIDQIMLTNDKL
uniref:Reverse transcriptase domain-containing protein n=1 Tax=Ascaris lumbricoides TaxID=6252 RepID=A0A0M3HUJ4_ASCLU